MKKIIIVYFIIFCQGLLGVEATNLSNIKTLKLYVKENLLINGERKLGEYELSIAFPDDMKKIQVSPEMNKGEIYIYTKEEKMVYLPFFNQVSKEKIKPNENTIMGYLKSIIELEKKDEKFRKDYTTGGVVSLVNESNEKIILKNMKKFDGVLFPTAIEVYSKEENIADIKIEKVEINPKFGKEEFKLELKK